jgi:hypothetical protein
MLSWSSNYYFGLTTIGSPTFAELELASGVLLVMFSSAVQDCKNRANTKSKSSLGKNLVFIKNRLKIRNRFLVKPSGFN